MKKPQLSLLVFVLLVSTTAVAFVFAQRLLFTRESAEPRAGTGSLRLVLDGSTHGAVAITLFQHGEVVASKDQRIGLDVRFERLPVGAYEVRCESPGHKTVVKRALLTVVEPSAEVIVEMVEGEGTTVIGAGPSLQELDARLRKLEADMAKLRGE